MEPKDMTETSDKTGMRISRLGFEKIFYHPEHLDQILRAGDAYPVHLELGLVNYCNHNCTFCYASRSMFRAKGNNRIRIDRQKLRKVIDEMASYGLKSATLVGSGEPTLHPEVIDIIRDIKETGVEVALFSNGSGLHAALNREIIRNCTFIRFSLTGASPEIHSLVHGATDYLRVVGNIRDLVKLRGSRKMPTIGIQYVLGSYSAPDVIKGAEQARELQVDYFEIKPCFPAPGNSTQIPNTLPVDRAVTLMRQAKQLETDDFKVYAKEEQLHGVFTNLKERIYDTCPGCCTTTTLEADLNLYLCDNQKVHDFIIGNLAADSFSEVWHSEKRKRLISSLDVSSCPPRCRMDPLNTLIQQIRKGTVAVPAELPPPVPELHHNYL